jgi:hypothetical protein
MVLPARLMMTPLTFWDWAKATVLTATVAKSALTAINLVALKRYFMELASKLSSPDDK